MKVCRAVFSLWCVGALVLLFTGCEKPERGLRPRPSFTQQEIIIGLIPEKNIFLQRERYQSLKDYLSEVLGIHVNFTSLSRYGNIVERFSKEKMDAAFFGSFTYVLARQQLGVEPVARPVNLDGTSTYHGYLFVRKDSGIRTVSDMKGKRFAFVERATMAGYLFPLAYFRKNGVRDPEKHLGETFFAGSHDAAINAVLNREAEIGASKNTIYDELATENARIERELLILASSEVVPQNCLAVRKDLEPELKKAIRQALIGMDKTSRGIQALRDFGARGFVETSDGDFDYLYKLSSEVGIDPKRYRYQNR